MSLIENAMAKLRRAGAPGATASSHTPSTASAASVPSAAVPPEPAYILKRVPLDRGALRNAGYLPEELFERRFADQFRQIKRPLIDKALAGNADKRLILVSSALPGDGKTFTSINLAFSMARERDVSVLLVDADAPRGRVSEVFGLRGERGLLDALSDTSVRVDSLIVETDVPGLQILPVGRFVEGATELFASTRMEEVAARIGIRDPRRLVLMDSAPLLVSSEGRALLRIPGQVILVARCGVTPRHAIAEAVALVDKSKIQGVVLNQASAMGGGYYNYGYGDEAAPEKYRD